MIGKLNRRVIIKTIAFTTDAGGGSSTSVTGSQSFWAYVEDRRGVSDIQEGQRQDSYDYRIHIRAYPSFPVTTNNVLEYNSQDLSIDSVQNLSEGKVNYLILKCSYHGS